MATDLIRYDLLVQNAFRDIFRKVMADVAAKGLPGEHHFLITFRTGAPGVKISDGLRQAHPRDMTIVLHHQFWDLTVTETGFSVGLSFKNVPEKLVVPFSSVTGFFDPSVNFGAEFTDESAEPAAEEAPRATRDRPLALASSKTKTRGSGSEPSEVAGDEGASSSATKSSPPPDTAPGRKTGKAALEAVPSVETPTPSKEPKVVSIDAFRKKT